MLKAIRCLLSIAVCLYSVPACAESVLESVLSLDRKAGEIPEGIALDARGNLYVSLAPLGQVRRISASGDQTILLELGMPGTTGIALDRSGAVYVAKQSENPEQPRGVIRIAPSGISEPLAGCERPHAPNGLVFDRKGRLYITDTSGGAIFRYRKRGRCELWLLDDVLAGDGSQGWDAGANGIAIREGALYVANLERGSIVRIPIRDDGGPGAAEVWLQHPVLIGVDGIAFGSEGALYAANVLKSTLVRIDPETKTPEVLATEADGLDNPASLAFGSRTGEEPRLYITNYPVLPPHTAPPGILAFKPAGD